MLMTGVRVVYVCLEGVLACVLVCTCVCVRTCAYDWVWAQNTLKNTCYADIKRKTCKYIHVFIEYDICACAFTCRYPRQEEMRIIVN